MLAPTDVYELPGTGEFPANVIARSSGARPVPELDRPIPSLNDGAKVVPPPSEVTTTAAIFRNESDFAAEELRADWRMEIVPPLGLALLSGSIFLALKVLPSGNFWAALGYLCAVGVAAIIGLASLYVVSMLFSVQVGSFGSVLVRCIAIKTILDVALLPIAAWGGGIGGLLLAIPLAALLVRWMFGLDRLQILIVLMINGFARLFVMGLILGSAMSARV